MNSKSEIHISLRTTPFYKSWDIKTIGEKAGYKLRKKIDFNEDSFIRYENKRTAGDDKFRAARAPRGIEDIHVQVYWLAQRVPRQIKRLFSSRFPVVYVSVL